MSFDRILRRGRKSLLGQLSIPAQGAVACPSAGGFDLHSISDPSQIIASGVPYEQTQINAVHLVNADDPRCAGQALPDYGDGGTPGLDPMVDIQNAMIRQQGGMPSAGLPQGGQTMVMLPSGPGSTEGWAQTYRPGQTPGGAGGEGDLSILDDEGAEEEKGSTTGRILAVGGMGAGVLVAALLATGALGD